jgi:DNA-binding transcriptional regulator YdaS (Cro superfamily)
VPTLCARTLSRAAEVVGGEEQLALLLRIAPSQLTLWLAGNATPPGDVFLNAVDIVGEHNIQALRSKRNAAAAGAA